MQTADNANGGGSELRHCYLSSLTTKADREEVLSCVLFGCKILMLVSADDT
jgi:hypothetical protein